MLPWTLNAIDRSKGGGGKQQVGNLLKIDDYIMKYLKGT